MKFKISTFYITILVFVCLFFSAGCSFFDNLNDKLNQSDSVIDDNLSATDDNMIAEVTPVPDYDKSEKFIRNNLLSDIEQKLYDSVYTSMVNNETTITFKTIDYVFPSVETLEYSISNAVYAVLYDNPDIFWYDNAFKYFYSETLNISDLEINMQFIFNDSKIKEMKQDIKIVTEDIISKTRGMDEYEISKFIYTYIIQNSVYAKTENMNNIYGILIDGSAVCEGYAKTYCYLMKKCGIECAIITGNSNNEEHAWNLVKINGEYYYVDCTWGDPMIELESQEEAKNYVDYTYLHMNSTDIQRSHLKDELYEKLPEFFSVNDNYYVKDGLYFESFDERDFNRKLHDEIKSLNHIKGEVVELKFKNPDDLEKAVAYIDENMSNIVYGLNNDIDKYSYVCSELGTMKLMLVYF